MAKRWALIDEKSGKEVDMGSTVLDFRGNSVVVEDFYPPADGKNGKVKFRGLIGIYYPSIIGCRIEEVEG